MNADKHFPTANGSGVAFFDYDGDGKLDVYFASATLLPVGSATKGPNRLYKNLGNGTFKDVTESSGLGFEGFCHGIVVGDIDNDGDARTSSSATTGRTALYLNNGDGTFQRRQQGGGGGPRSDGRRAGRSWTMTTTGTLIFYVANYGKWKLPEDSILLRRQGEATSGSIATPRTIKTGKHMFYRNNGNGTFTDVYDQVFVDVAGQEDPGPDRRPRLRRRRGRPQRRRQDRPLCHQRHEPQLPLHQPGRRHVFEDATETSGRRLRPTRARRSRAWGSTPRTSTATATWT